MDSLEATRQTYRQIADNYAQARQARDKLRLQIERFAALVGPGGVVIDMGCGPGFDTAVLQQHHLQAVGLDYTMEMMQAGRQGYGLTGPFLQGDMRRLPLGQSVDGIWACASLLHLEREALLPTLQEFYRVLKPGGVIYLSVKLGIGARFLVAPYSDQQLTRYFTYWQPADLDHQLETAAFVIIAAWQQPGRYDPWLVRFAQKKEAPA